MRNERTIITLLIGGGLVILAGFAFIGIEVYKRAADPAHPRTFSARFNSDATETPPAAPPQPPSPPAAPAAPASGPLMLPPGAEMLPGLAALDGRLAVQIRQPDGRIELWLVDPARATGTVLITPSP